MASAAAAAASYARALTDTLTLTRLTGGVPSQTEDTAQDIRCRVRNYAAHEIAGAVVQGDQEIIVLAADLLDVGFPAPPKKGDRVTKSDGTTATVQACDANTRKIGVTLIAYVLQVRG